MSDPSTPAGFDPRRLADLASRFAPRPAPAAEPGASAPGRPTVQPAPPPSAVQPAPSAVQPAPPPSAVQPAAQPSAVQPAAQPSTAQPGVDARPDAVRTPAGTGESTGAAGHLHIDAVLAELDKAERLPPDQQIPVYESIHRTLQETLRSIEQS